MIKKGLGKLLAVVGLLSAPGAVIASAAPAEVVISAPYKSTDGRSTRYYVPKGMKRKRSRVSTFMEAVFGRPRGGNRNRFARRSVCKAFVAGRGRATKGAGTFRYYVGDRRPTTRRAIERSLNVAAFLRMRQGREVARRVLAAQ